MADNPATAAAREQMQRDREYLEKGREVKEAIQGKPTPTQEECDLAKLGAAPESLEPDGSQEVVMRTGPFLTSSTPAAQGRASGSQQARPRPATPPTT